MSIRLRRTTEDDLDFVLSAEWNPANSPFVACWSREQHASVFAAPDGAHLIIETQPEGQRVGYVIMAGLQNPNASIELGRIVITEKNHGYGREALRLVKSMAFEELNAHRLWLDVKAHNQRARHLYESEGFIFEGTLRDCVKTNAGFESLVIMSILRDEYNSVGK